MANNKVWGCLAVAFIAVLLMTGFVLWPILRFFLASGKHMTVRERASVVLPDGTKIIEHSRIGINPIVAEYSRDVTYIKNGVAGKTTPLSIDTCGGYPINCYFINIPSGCFLRLDDAVSEHLLDLANEKTYLVVQFEGVKYAGELVDESISISIYDKGSKPITDFTKGLPETYIGRIDGNLGNLRFIPGSEAAEVRIRHLFDH